MGRLIASLRLELLDASFRVAWRVAGMPRDGLRGCPCAVLGSAGVRARQAAGSIAAVPRGAERKRRRLLVPTCSCRESLGEIFRISIW